MSDTGTTDIDLTSDDEEAAKKKTVTITVNDDPVTLVGKRHTGAEIKAAAIAAGVEIEPDYVLSRIRANGKEKTIADDKEISLVEGEEFSAIPGDDNS